MINSIEEMLSEERIVCRSLKKKLTGSNNNNNNKKKRVITIMLKELK